ncbi:D-isomer specific 2-hydroxyacid dehydrogenase, NAD binding domain [Lentzea albida]|uniref:D-isomer specific 2-hydroxyacid dehydrogenase, NAD binding domain n=1 Tax=Lentzea albida TaxID=65499 RepID=A0A1H9X619_9PSEU|nr:D-isomer specific 2-hydroxyacid dehydrogenase, NAD binding domain [Lentzea albida]
MNGFLGLDAHGATVGLVGYGQIARAVTRRAAGFGLRIQHHDPHQDGEAPSAAISLPGLLRTSDVVALHVPLTPDTLNLIGAAELALMKPTATLASTARGVVDEAALLAASRSGCRTRPDWT